MGDFPRNLVVPSHINTWMEWMVGTVGARVGALGSPGIGLAWTANVALYVPFILPWPYNVRRAFWVNGSSVGGNSDIGIYTPGGARLWSSGSTVASGGSAPQYVTPSPDIMLHPGVTYFLGFAHDSSTASHIDGISNVTVTASWGRACGLYQQSTAFPLPLNATFSAYAGVGLMLAGITNTDSGF